MIVLKSTAQLRLVFNKLIKTLSVPIDWNGNFIVSGNFLILPGKERSVIFNYDTRRVTTNLSDDKLGRKSAEPIENDSQLVNIFNLVLYAFGKWGALKGITVEKDYKKINSLFAAVFGEFGVAADYTAQHCFWYKDGTRITYEDAIQLAIDSEQQKVMDDEIAQEETGLWHSTVWKVEEEQFKFEKLPMSQRRKGRIGHNFYKVGYDCPHCNGKLYMASFSKKEKPVIDTVEGRVQLARAFFCTACVIFYTPLPDAGLEDEEVYCLDFDGDTTAGNDYMEMLGRLGTKEPNSEFNRYVDRVKEDTDSKKKENLNDIDKGISDDRRSLNGIDKGIKDDRSDLNGIDKGTSDDRRSLNGVRKFDDENEQISDKVSGNPDKEDVFDIVHEKAAVMADIDGTGELHTYRKDASHVRCKDAIKSSRRKLRIRRLAVLFKSFSIVKWFRRKVYGKASEENSDKEPYRNAERISAPGAVTASDGKAGYTMREEAESAPAQRRKLDELLEKTGNATRKDIVDLLDKVKAGHFDKTVQMEYAGKLQEDIAALDRRRIDEACKGYLDYNGEELEKLYSMIEEEEFLPEIKAAALDSVAGRLWKIRNEEAELLVKRIKKSLCENGVSENHALYFYPAMEILEGRADTHVKDHLECAVDSYAPGLGKYEYPVIMEDTTGKQNGKRGMFITPDAIYYGNFYTYGHIMAENIERIGSYTGFMGRYVIVYLDDGSKIRLSSVIAKDELEAYAMTLNDFVMYLKQKPFSRKEKYLAKESHDVICCFRCGYVYKNMKECPKCGYKFNI